MSYRVLVTGSSGLVGRSLCAALESSGAEVERFDIDAAGTAYGDVRDSDRVRSSVLRCDGVVHLAAVSRVSHAERDRAQCWSVNVDGSRNVLAAAGTSPGRPWIVFASSREVYGEPARLPVHEDAPLRPMNTYGRSKVAGEEMMEAARRAGTRACVARLSNVFGSIHDHPDRVIPSFVRRALMSDALRVDGAEHTFDFTHVDDVARGLLQLVEMLASGEAAPPPLQLVSGVPTKLGDLATTVVEIAGSQSTIQEAPPRDFDVTRFVGAPERARGLLGWAARTSLRDGLRSLMDDHRRAMSAASILESSR